MKSSDKQLLKTAGIAGVDAIAATIDLSLGGTPLVSGAWALSKALLGNGLALRQKKATEWVEMIRDNPTIFTKQILESEEFQEAFVVALEDYIKERNSDKRILLRAIFKDYTTVKDPSTYPLERLDEITRQLTITDMKAFSYLIYLSTEQNNSAPIHTNGNTESTFHLISLGLLRQDFTPRLISEDVGTDHPYVYVSGLGGHYYKFILEAQGVNQEFIK